MILHHVFTAHQMLYSRIDAYKTIPALSGWNAGQVAAVQKLRSLSSLSKYEREAYEKSRNSYGIRLGSSDPEKVCPGA